MKIPSYYKEYLYMTKIDLNKVETFRTIKKWKKGKILDIGCGIGYLTNFLNGDGIDKNRSAIKVASSIYPNNNFFNISIRKLPDFLKKFKRNYKTVLCYNLIEHLSKNERNFLFKTFYKYFDNKTLFIFGYANPYNFFQLLVGFLRKKVLFDKTHHFNWTVKEFYKLISENFEIISFKMTSPFTRLTFITKFIKGDILILAKLKKL
jgi:2-polyprenyl-3-methyl-5-hydroxy-6-metoxy-1,4-benzoquinol methylase